MKHSLIITGLTLSLFVTAFAFRNHTGVCSPNENECVVVQQIASAKYIPYRSDTFTNPGRYASATRRSPHYAPYTSTSF